MEFRRLLFHKPSPRGPTPLVKGRCRAKRDRGDRDGCRAYARRMRGRSSSVFVCRREFRRLRAANYFAHGGSSSQWPRPPSLVPSGQFTLSPLHSVSAWRRKLRSFPCSSSSRRTRFAGLRREQRGIGQNATGDGSDEHFVLIVAFPRNPFYGGRQLGCPGSQRKGAGGSADWFPFYDRCR